MADTKWSTLRQSVFNKVDNCLAPLSIAIEPHSIRIDGPPSVSHYQYRSHRSWADRPVTRPVRGALKAMLVHL